MAEKESAAPLSQERRNLAPWGSPLRMKLLAIVAIGGGILLVIAGIVVLAMGQGGTHRQGLGWTLLIIGVFCSLPIALALPSARKRGKL